MDEATWLTCIDPLPMLNYLEGKVSERKLRLFVCACCRRLWHLLDDQGSRGVVEVAERRADGEASNAEIFAGMKQANAGHIQAIAAMMSSGSRDQTDFRAKTAVLYTLQPNTASAARITSRCAAESLASPRGGLDDPSVCSAPALAAEKQAQAALLRDLFGNPFRPFSVNPAWLVWEGGTLLRLARAAYEERSLPEGALGPARLAILADALQEAGRPNRDLLSHCLSPGPHVRGCWALDALLGKR
jgi:hypothetical protein